MSTAPGKLPSAALPPAAHNLFEVFLRLRPPLPGAGLLEHILDVEPSGTAGVPASHITLIPPTDRRRAVEKFAFTQVFEEDATQLHVFHFAGLAALAEGVLAPKGGEGTDAVVATLGVTGSGKTHTILGSRSQRGLTQIALGVLFCSIGSNMVDTKSLPSLLKSLQASDSSESILSSAAHFSEVTFADASGTSRANSRAGTPMTVRCPFTPLAPTLHLRSLQRREVNWLAVIRDRAALVPEAELSCSGVNSAVAVAVIVTILPHLLLP